MTSSTSIKKAIQKASDMPCDKAICALFCNSAICISSSHHSFHHHGHSAH